MIKVRIVMSNHGRGEVFIDGNKVEGVRAVSFAAAVDQINVLEIKLGPAEVEIDGVADITTIGDTERRFEKAI